MAHGPKTDVLIQRSVASLSGQDWLGPAISKDETSAVEMTVMFLVALAARDDEDFRRAVDAFKVSA
jgi:hypothetical protein